MINEINPLINSRGSVKMAVEGEEWSPYTKFLYFH
jgi:hypothetical protein